MLDVFLKTLSEELELEGIPERDAQKWVHFVLNDAQEILMQELESGILLKGRIGSIQQEKQEELFLKLMGGNFLGQGTGRAIIGLDANEKFLTLSCVLPYDMNYKMFKLALEDFANYLAYWQEELIAFYAKAG